MSLFLEDRNENQQTLSGFSAETSVASQFYLPAQGVEKGRKQERESKQNFSSRTAQAEETGFVPEHKMKIVHKEGDGKPLGCAVSHLQDLPLSQILNQHN